MFILTPPLVNWPGPDCDNDRDDGFTLIEILVVIIIIGILAAVAIPMFLNQQKTARDSATTQDTRNAATALESGLVYDDTATSFKAYEDAAGTTPYAPLSGLAPGEEAVVIPGEDEEFYVRVGDGPITKTKKTEGTSLLISNDDIDGDGSPEAGAFRVDGWNEKGREHVSESTLVYRNALGGLQSEKGGVGAGGVTNPGDDTENPGESTTPPTEEVGDFSEYTEYTFEAYSAGSSGPQTAMPGDTINMSFKVLADWQSGNEVFAPDGTKVAYAVALQLVKDGPKETLKSGVAVVQGGEIAISAVAPSANFGSVTPSNYTVVQFEVQSVEFPDGKTASVGSGSRFNLALANRNAPAGGWWVNRSDEYNGMW